MKATLQVYIHHFVPQFFGRAEHVAIALDPRIADQHINPTELLTHRLNTSCHASFFGYVAFKKVGASPARTDTLCGFLTRANVAIQNRHLRPKFRKLLRCGESNAHRAARH